MTTHDHSDERSPNDGVAVDRDRIARELAALGEPPPSASELDGASKPGDEEVDADVATTRALFAVAAAHTGAAEGLTPFETRRVWKRLAGRVASSSTERAVGGGHDTGRRVFAALAMAAAVVLFTRLAIVGQVPSAPGDEGNAVAEALGAQARAGLDVLGGEVDGARARALADDYATRLRVGGEGT